MSYRLRLEKFADQVKDAGLRGESMQAKLASIVGDNDLTAHEIRRIAEMANRNVQLGLYKTAQDKRFKFALCDAEPLVQEARKAASTSFSQIGEDDAKLAAAIEEAGGDPFAAPIQSHAERLSLFHQPLDEKLAHSLEEAETRTLLLQLDQNRTEMAELIKEAGAARVELYDNAAQAHKKAVQAAVDLVASGVTFPSMYEAIYASVSGGTAGVDPVKHADEMGMLILQGLKERGVPNHKLGFRYPADLGAIDKLSAGALLAMAKQCLGYPVEGPELCLESQKQAQRYLESIPKSLRKSDDQHPFQDADDWLDSRPSIAQHKIPQSYLDDVDNLKGKKPIVVDGDAEFVIGIRDLMGARDRLMKIHAAQEYLGLKVKQIEHSMRQLKTAQELSSQEAAARIEAAEEAKQAGDEALRRIGEDLSGDMQPKSQLLKALVGKGDTKEAIAPALGALAAGAGRVLASPATTNALGVAGLGATGVQMIQNSRAEKRQRQQQQQQAGAPAANV